MFFFQNNGVNFKNNKYAKKNCEIDTFVILLYMIQHRCYVMKQMISYHIRLFLSSSLGKNCFAIFPIRIFIFREINRLHVCSGQLLDEN